MIHSIAVLLVAVLNAAVLLTLRRILRERRHRAVLRRRLDEVSTM